MVDRLQIVSHAARLVVAVLALSIVSGCNSVKFVYNRLDWLGAVYARSMVSLTDDQVVQLDTQLDTLHHWHCRSQLDGYARWLRAVNDDVQNARADYATMARRMAELQDFWRKLMAETGRSGIEFLPTLSDAQVQEFFASLEKDNRRWRKESIDSEFEVRVKRWRHQMEENLERVFGDLTPVQQQAVAAWASESVTATTGDSLIRRQVWQAELRRVLEVRADATALRTGLQRLLIEPERLQNPDMLRRQNEQRDRVLRLLVAVGSTLTPEQREHYSKRTTGWARDFDELSCPESQR